MVQCSAYDTHDEASRAVADLLAAGVDGAAIRVLMGERERDASAEAMGAFAGAVPAGAPMGGFAGAREGMGGFAGDTAMQRGGSFADADRETVTSYPDGIAQLRVAGHARIKRYLMEAGLDEATAERDVEALHLGRVLVLVSSS
jgi:hypothetical protein